MNLLLVVTVLFGLLAVMVALYLIKLTEHKLAWIILSLGLLLAALLRLFRYLNFFITSSFLSSPYLTHAIAFIVSVLLFIGLYLIIPVVKSIKLSEARYRSIFDTSGVSIWEEDHYGIYMLLEELKKTGVTNLRDYITEHPEFIEEAIECINVIGVNQATLDLFKARGKKIFLGNLGITFTPQSDQIFIDELVSAFDGNTVFEAETQYKDLEGNLLNVIIKIVDPEEKEPGKTSIVSITDITARVLAEKKLLAVLEEKNTLLKELYHRTKNNMQVIIAMLNLRSYSSKNEIVSTNFNDMINRIQSMALVHEKLYKSDNLSVMRLDEYIEDFMSLLINSESLFSSKINLILDLDPVSVDIDRAIPCGLILNELISNIFKHAFKNINSGEIKIGLHNLEGDKVEIVVADDGNGFLSEFDVHKCDTLGLQTVFALGEDQLHGSVDIVSSPDEQGVTWRLVFNNQTKIPRI